VCINLPANHRPEARARGLLTSVGRAGLGAEIIVADESGRELPRGEVGEILRAGPW
jgi:long-chain acyl-CoA synthetase